MNSYAVVFTYSFDSDTSVYLFDTFEEAYMFLEDSYNEELRIQTEENGWDAEGFINEDMTYAKILTRFDENVDVTEYHIGNVYK